MKLFGEYLIEKGLLNTDHLAEALVEQGRGLPTVAQVIFDEKLLKNEQILSIFKRQVSHKQGFVEAAKSASLWTDEIATQVEKSINQRRVPLGQVLIRMGCASLEQITKALDDFLSDVASPAQSSSPQYSAYCDCFNPSLQSLFARLLPHESQCIAVDPAQAPTSLRDLAATVLDEVHHLKDAALLVNAQESAQLLEVLEGFLQELSSRDPSAFKPELIKKIHLAYSEGVKALYFCKECLASGQSIDAKKVSGAIDGLEMARFDLTFEKGV